MPSLSSVSRRRFLASAAGLGSMVVLAACQGAASPTAAPAKTESKPAESKPAESKPAAAATTAPAAAATTAPAAASKDAPKAAAPQPKAGQATLDAWWGALGGGAQAPAREMAEKAFMEQNPDVLLKSTTFPGGWAEMWEKTLTAMAANTVAPAIALAVFDTGMYAERNGIRNLEPYIQADPAYARDKYLSATTRSTVYDGKMFALPWNLSGITFIRNLTLFEQAGIKAPPKTWDEVVENAKKMTKPDQQQYGFDLSYTVDAATTSNVYGPILMSFGASWFDSEDGAQITKAAFNTEQGVAALQWVVDLIHVHKAAVPPGVTIQQARPNNKVGQWTDGQWTISSFAKDAPNLKWEPSLLPESKFSKGMTVTGGNHWGITQAAKEPDLAWRWLKFIAGEQWDYEYASRAGYLPAHESGYAKAPYNEMPWKVFGEQARFNSKVRPAIPEINESFVAIGREIEAAAFQRQTPKEAMAKAETKVNEILAKKRKK
jgi:multiple sugar transport system substrate-binding protein